MVMGTTAGGLLHPTHTRSVGDIQAAELAQLKLLNSLTVDSTHGRQNRSGSSERHQANIHIHHPLIPSKNSTQQMDGSIS